MKTEPDSSDCLPHNAQASGPETPPGSNPLSTVGHVTAFGNIQDSGLRRHLRQPPQRPTIWTHTNRRESSTYLTSLPTNEIHNLPALLISSRAQALQHPPTRLTIMKLHYIGIVRNEDKPAHEIVAEKELSAYSRFTRNKSVPVNAATPPSRSSLNVTMLYRHTNLFLAALSSAVDFVYGEFMTLFAKTVAERTKPGQRQDVEEQDYTFHAYGRSEGICGIIISDHQYPALVAHQLLSKVVDEFLSAHPRSSWQSGTPELPMPELKQYLAKYQDPQQADSIMKIQKELDETKIVLHKTIESVLQRGEKIDDLVAKSDGLSSQSKMFYQQAKKQNSCCVLM
ncbi:hypothetical protein E4U60_001350 [Claviceps pazoutovae]|uniref:Synaptobrevin homolog YKT6 n=1 Tax=Claviceps pazoutovae TaxID=1649127 RepID=A0A9P7MDC7_9HYPO|nr:hypothetical protein E4U60_001350 [Claviceps pazoutovae]